MRTTLTIDDDVAAELERLRRSRDASLKDLVNDALRRGLHEMTSPSKKRKPFRTKSFDCGRLLIDSIDNVLEVLDQIEGERICPGRCSVAEYSCFSAGDDQSENFAKSFIDAGCVG